MLNLWNLTHDDLRWSWCNNNINKVHSECDVILPKTTPLPWCGEKLCSPKLLPSAKKIGDRCYETQDAAVDALPSASIRITQRAA